MKYLHLILANLGRKKTRTVLTLLSIVVAFFLFGMLQAVNHAFQSGADNAQADRLVTNSRYSIIELLPLSYAARITGVPGVRAVSHATWFGGSYEDKPAPFAIFPVDHATYFDVTPELRLPAEQREAWNTTRTGVLIGQRMAERFGWKIGDRVPIKPDIWQRGDGGAWEFDVVGIYRNEVDANNGEMAMILRYDYFDEARAGAKGRIGWFLVKVADPAQADQVAQDIDALFANSPDETKTQTEKAFAQGFVKQFGDIGFIVSAILGAVFFTILVLTGNTLAQSFRERIPELGILKTLGFSDGRILGFVMSESLLYALIGGLVGLGLAAVLLATGMLGQLGVDRLAAAVWLYGLLAMVALGIAVGLFPALAAVRLKIIDALNA